MRQLFDLTAAFSLFALFVLALLRFTEGDRSQAALIFAAFSGFAAYMRLSRIVEK
jgi:hypothetical protein